MSSQPGVARQTLWRRGCGQKDGRIKVHCKATADFERCVTHGCDSWMNGVKGWCVGKERNIKVIKQGLALGSFVPVMEEG